jgi:phosphohistidine phosphatase
MKLYFLRHADAAPGADDAARPLTPRGHRECDRLGKFLRQAGIQFTAAYASPLVRAQETVQRVLAITNQDPALKPHTVEALLNEFADFGKWLRKIPNSQHVVLVGHAPSLTAHACELLDLEPDEGLSLPKGGIVCIQTDNRRRGRLKWYLTPKLLGVSP